MTDRFILEREKRLDHSKLDGVATKNYLLYTTSSKDLVSNDIEHTSSRSAWISKQADFSSPTPEVKIVDLDKSEGTVFTRNNYLLEHALPKSFDRPIG
jgi:hypothetical protein